MLDICDMSAGTVPLLTGEQMGRHYEPVYQLLKGHGHFLDAEVTQRLLKSHDNQLQLNSLERCSELPAVTRKEEGVKDAVLVLRVMTRNTGNPAEMSLQKSIVEVDDNTCLQTGGYSKQGPADRSAQDNDRPTFKSYGHYRFVKLFHFDHVYNGQRYRLLLPQKMCRKHHKWVLLVFFVADKRGEIESINHDCLARHDCTVCPVGLGAVSQSEDELRCYVA